MKAVKDPEAETRSLPIARIMASPVISFKVAKPRSPRWEDRLVDTVPAFVPL